jgi:arabinofuranosyltransferase
MKTTLKALALIASLAAATWWTFTLHGFPEVGVDDANIFFSYAENLAAGNGITYAHNPEHVEGFTSMRPRFRSGCTNPHCC